MKKFVAILTLLIAATSCIRDVAVFHDSDPTFNHRSYETYRWEPIDPMERSQYPLYYNDLNHSRITTATSAVLAEKGYVADTLSPDLKIHYHIVVEDKTIVFPHDMLRYARDSETGGAEYQYAEGTLILDFMDTQTGKLMWRGWAVAQLENISNSDDVTNLFRSLVENILAAFPPCATTENAEVNKTHNNDR